MAPTLTNTPNLLPTIDASLEQAIALLDSPGVRALLHTHPNDLGVWPVNERRPYPFGEDWWTAWLETEEKGFEEDVPLEALGIDNNAQTRPPWVRVLAYYLKRLKGKGKETVSADADADTDYSIPLQIRTLIDSLVALSLPRACVVHPKPTQPAISTVGLSPKKVHEVTQCVAYISSLLPSLPRNIRIVDVGSGQGYLTRALQAHLRAQGIARPHLLALDSNEVQTSGASRWDTVLTSRKSKSAAETNVGGITQKTIHITPATLLAAVDEWITETALNVGADADKPIPVLFVALHACGSLTPDIFRAFFASGSRRKWSTTGVIAVGCCYNLLAPQGGPILIFVFDSCFYLYVFHFLSRRHWRSASLISRAPDHFLSLLPFVSSSSRLANLPTTLYYTVDFPLSQRVRTLSPSPALALPGSAYHLAAQIPAEWARDGAAWRFAALAVRKVVWRAVVGGRIANWEIGGEEKEEEAQSDVQTQVEQQTTQPQADLSQAQSQPTRLGAAGGWGAGTGDKPAMRRLGRLNDAVYKDWAGFARAARDKLCPPASNPTATSRVPDLGLATDAPPDALTAALTPAELLLTRELGVLHVLRCLVGPVVESVLVGDRAVWVREQMEGGTTGTGLDAKLGMEVLNLFDQATGSGRNIVIALAPAVAPTGTHTHISTGGDYR
ncbi:Methyltranfer-dom domain-containing protein [Mycena kentingensis (nom. inval.)]|nr:Methyltranfer-dom domain-containing protein [Mycena kentingensis (nom. inval.)]